MRSIKEHAGQWKYDARACTVLADSLICHGRFQATVSCGGRGWLDAAGWSAEPSIYEGVHRSVDGNALAGYTILVLEDEPLIALEVMELMRQAGASVLGARCVRDALVLADHAAISVAILDFGLSDGDASAVCERLKARNIPFVLYSGYEDMHDACPKCIHLPKPAAPAALINAVARLLH